MVGLRILVVEDEGMIAMAIEETIVQMGHVVCAIAGTEAEAVAAAYRTHPDLMIVDGRLRVGSGISAMRKILTRRYIPHIYVSGDSLVAEDIDPRSVVLRKPFSDDELVAAIARALHVPSVHTSSGDDPEKQPDDTI